MKTFPVLYKYSQKGQIQTWQIIVNNDEFWTIEGIQNGKLTTSLPTKCKGKNIGKKNEKSPEAQTILEAQAKWQKKKDNSYNEILTTKRNFVEPMLAHSLKDYEKLLFTVKTYIQPKLDGLSCINRNNTLMSRNGKPFLSCPHLYQNKVTCQGELYGHTNFDNFNKIVSLCKKVDPSKEELEESAKLVQYWIYDFPETKGVFSTRYEALRKWIITQENKSFVLTPTYEVKSMADINKRHEEFLALGFEGSIIRLDLGDYENKRSKQVLKKKDFTDEEYVIKDVIEGEGGRTGTVGKFIMELGDGRDFGSNVKGTHEYLRELLIQKNDLIGRKATVKSFAKTPAGIPRFGYVIKIDRDSYE